MKSERIAYLPSVILHAIARILFRNPLVDFTQCQFTVFAGQDSMGNDGSIRERRLFIEFDRFPCRLDVNDARRHLLCELGFVNGCFQWLLL